MSSKAKVALLSVSNFPMASTQWWQKCVTERQSLQPWSDVHTEHLVEKMGCCDGSCCWPQQQSIRFQCPRLHELTLHVPPSAFRGLALVRDLLLRSFPHSFTPDNGPPEPLWVCGCQESLRRRRPGWLKKDPRGCSPFGWSSAWGGPRTEQGQKRVAPSPGERCVLS